MTALQVQAAWHAGGSPLAQEGRSNDKTACSSERAQQGAHSAGQVRPTQPACRDQFFAAACLLCCHCRAASPHVVCLQQNRPCAESSTLTHVCPGTKHRHVLRRARPPPASTPVHAPRTRGHEPVRVLCRARTPPASTPGPWGTPSCCPVQRLRSQLSRRWLPLMQRRLPRHLRLERRFRLSSRRPQVSGGLASPHWSKLADAWGEAVRTVCGPGLSLACHVVCCLPQQQPTCTQTVICFFRRPSPSCGGSVLRGWRSAGEGSCQTLTCSAAGEPSLRKGNRAELEAVDARVGARGLAGLGWLASSNATTCDRAAWPASATW